MNLRQVLGRFPRMFRPSSASEIFRRIRDERLETTIWYPVILLLIESVFISIVGFFVVRWLFSGIQIPYEHVFHLVSLGIIPFTVIAGVFVLFAVSVLIHISLRVLGVRAGFSQTFKAVAYGSTPSMATIIVPPIIVLTIPLSLMIISVGLRELHGISGKRAAGSILAVIGVGVMISLVSLIL